MTKIKKIIGVLFMGAALTTAGVPSAFAAGGLRLWAGKITFDSGFAQRNGLGEEALDISAEFDFSVWKRLHLGLGAGLLFLDDERQFSVRVAPVDGPNISYNAKTEKMGGILHPFLKWNQPLNKYASVHTLVGYSFLRFKREIDNCIDCPSEEVDIDNGLSYGCGLTVRPIGKIDLMVQYLKYNSDDVKNELMVGIGGSF